MNTNAIKQNFPIIIGLLSLYTPVYSELWLTLWQIESNSHAPLIALIVCGLFLQRSKMNRPLNPSPFYGIPLLLAGLILVFLGYSLDIPFLSMASQIPVIAGILLTFQGPTGVKNAAFPLFFLCFMLPIPGFVFDALTSSLKESLSAITVQFLYWANYPIAQRGVIVLIGQYQLLIADACSGLHTLLSLIALGVLFVYFSSSNKITKALLLLSIIPVALFSNLLRVILLTLITFHFGDNAGREWHELSGIALFIVSGLLLFGIEKLLSTFLNRRANHAVSHI